MPDAPGRPPAATAPAATGSPSPAPVTAAVAPTVVLVGLGVLAADRHDRLRAVTEPDPADPLADLAGIVQPMLARGPVVVVHPEWDPRASRTVDSLHVALDDPAFLRHATPLPPLAAAALGGLAVRLGGRVRDAATLAAGLASLEAAVTAGAVLDSVTRLENLRASVGQHVASWMPGQRFVAVVGDQTGVRRFARNEPVVLPEVGDDRIVVAAAATESRLDRDVLDALADQGVEVDPSDLLDLPELSASWWGSGRGVEFAFVPTDEAAASHVRRAVGPSEPCPWCGRGAPGPRCGWCGHERVTAASS